MFLKNKKITIVHILHSATKYEGEFVVEDHYAGEVEEYFGERTDWREPTIVLIHPGNLTTPHKETMVPNYDTYTW